MFTPRFNQNVQSISIIQLIKTFDKTKNFLICSTKLLRFYFFRLPLLPASIGLIIAGNQLFKKLLSQVKRRYIKNKGFIANYNISIKVFLLTTQLLVKGRMMKIDVVKLTQERPSLINTEESRPMRILLTFGLWKAFSHIEINLLENEHCW